jgi:DNA-binding NarL/FixJ family response regulator
MSAVANPHYAEPATPVATKVLIADDHPLILAGIRRTLERADDIEVVGEAMNGPQVLAMIERRRPQVVLLDYRMPGVTGAELISAIHRQWPEVRTIVLSANDDRPSIEGAFGAGASAYIVKSVNAVDLPSVVRQVAGGDVFHSAGRPLIGAPQVAAAEPEPVAADLTDREREILTAIASGKTTAAISAEMWVSEHTVKFHLTNIYRKLGVGNRAGAVRFAIEHGLAG